jgi:hypothetical protein
MTAKITVRLALCVSVVIAMVFAIDPAWADMANYIVEAQCDNGTATAVIKLDIAYNGDTGPTGAIDAEKLSDRTVVCDFGLRGTVAVQAGLSDDHPRDDNATIYIDNSEAEKLWWGSVAGELPNEITVLFADGSSPRYCLGDDQSHCANFPNHK